MKKKLLSLLLVLALLVTLAAGCGGGTDAGSTPDTAAETVKYTDSVGREVEIPKNVERIAPSGTMAQIVTFALAPDKLVGLSGKWTVDAEKYLDQKYLDLPVFGQFYGAADLNTEALAAADPQLIIDIGEKKDSIAEDMDSIQEQTGIPTIFIECTLAGAADCYTELGTVLGMEDEAKTLSDYCQKTYDDTVAGMKKVGDDKKVKALYCLGDKGINIIAKGSYHAEVLDLLTDNLAVVDDPSSKGTGNEVSMEQIYLWNPDTIIFAPDSYYANAGTDPAWQDLSAIQNKSYYETPAGPYNWMGFPPSVNRYMGMIWLANLLYPDTFDYDLKEKTMEYYKLFYHCDLTASQYNELTANSLGQ